jgi:hypothetical protein
MKILFLIVCVFIIKVGFGQVDSIEYNEFEQINKIEIEYGEYYFRSFGNGAIIENDSLIFNAVKYFQNYNLSEHVPDYLDSIRFIIVSRTLRYYNEPILYNKEHDFLRICYFQDSITKLFRIGNENESESIISKQASGWFIRKGKLTNEKTLKLSSKDERKLHKSMLNTNINSLNNKILCPDPEIGYPLTFFVEIKEGNNYNVFTITECNFKEHKYKDVIKIYHFLMRIVKKEN